MGVEEEGQSWREAVDVEAAGQHEVDVAERVGEREGDLLGSGRTRFADVVAGDGDRIPPRHLFGAEGDQVRDQAQRVGGRVDVGPASDVLLEDVVLDRAADLGPRYALLFRDGEVHREQDRRRRVDRHRGRHLAERDAVEERPHVLDAVDRYADPTDFAAGGRSVRVVADLGGQVEGDGEAGRALFQEIAVAAVRLRGAGVAGVLAHGPQPLAVHVLVEPAGEGELAGRVRSAVLPREVIRREERRKIDTRARGAVPGHGKGAYRRLESWPGERLPEARIRRKQPASPQLLRLIRESACLHESPYLVPSPLDNHYILD